VNIVQHIEHNEVGVYNLVLQLIFQLIMKSQLQSHYHDPYQNSSPTNPLLATSPSDKNLSQTPFTLHYGQIQSTIKRCRLWFYIIIALAVATFNWIVGGLAIATYFHKGPLSSAQIPLNALTGSVVNPANLAALITGFGSVLAAASHLVQAGVSRSWLFRTSSQGIGIPIRQWQAAASGGGVRRLVKSPWTAGGIPLILLVSAGLMSSTYAGVLVPTRKFNHVGATFTKMPGYIGNAGIGNLVSCLNATSIYSCPTLKFGLVSSALSWGADRVGQEATLQIQSQSVDIDSKHSAGLALLVHNGTAGALVSNDTKLINIRGPGTKLAVSCSKNVAGISTDGRYYYRSSCFGDETTIRFFGNANNTRGTYTTASGCATPKSYTFEYAIGDSDLSPKAPTGILSFTCEISANEGVLTTYIQGPQTAFDNFLPGQDMTGEEVRLFGSALVAAVLQDGAVDGKKGSIGEAMIYSVMNNNTANMDIASTIIGNGATAAALAGYFSLSATHAVWTYPTLHSGWWKGYIETYGWVGRWSMLIWGIVAVLLGLGWMVSGIYMIKGGTSYDPTE